MIACRYDSCKEGYKIFLNDTVYQTIGCTKGSFNVIFCRLLGLSYVDFFRFLLKNYKVVLRGKNSKYISFFFTEKKEGVEFCNEINKRWNYVLSII